MSRSQPKHIVVFLPNWVGDVVMATPVLRSLREGFAGSRITYFGRKIALDVLAGNQWSDGELCDQSTNKPRFLNFLRTAWKLRTLKADAAILLPNSFRSALLARLSKASRRVGYRRDGRAWLLTDCLDPQRDNAGKFTPLPMIDYYAEILKKFDIELSSRQMELVASPGDQTAADELLTEVGWKQCNPLVMLNPGASFGTSKLWSGDRYAAVADELIEQRGAQIIINSAPNSAERELARKVAATMKHEPLINFANRENSLGLLKALAGRCNLLITNDTGARHIAAAMGAGVVTIFGSTDPIWAQIDCPNERIIRADVSCSPCQQKFCPLPQGTEHHRCMKAVTTQSVLEAALELIAELEVRS